MPEQQEPLSASTNLAQASLTIAPKLLQYQLLRSFFRRALWKSPTKLLTLFLLAASLVFVIFLIRKLLSIIRSFMQQPQNWTLNSDSKGSCIIVMFPTHTDCYNQVLHTLTRVLWTTFHKANRLERYSLAVKKKKMCHTYCKSNPATHFIGSSATGCWQAS